jgi:hypothetical protein
MKLADWLAIVRSVQNGWTLTALIAIICICFFSGAASVKAHIGKSPRRSFGRKFWQEENGYIA